MPRLKMRGPTPATPPSCLPQESLPLADLPANLRKGRLRPDEAAEYLFLRWGLRVARRTLDGYRSRRRGPAFRSMAVGVTYDRCDLDSWAVEKLGAPVRSTSEADAGAAA